MPIEASFLVEDFLGAVASQLDRTQDLLALKAVNRPLTYAIKDFTMELKVFVEMDADGKVRFRTPAANESGASAVHIGFTTITRPMIQENTVELALTRSPSLSESGLSEAERRRLEQLGVRTSAELARLGSSTGTEGVARIADIPIERLRAALAAGRPQVREVRPAPPRPTSSRPTPPSPAPAPSAPSRPAPPARSPIPPRISGPRAKPRPAPAPPPIRIPPATRRLEVRGRNMTGPDGPPQIRLGGRPLSIESADEHCIVVDLGEDLPLVSTLEVDDGDGEVTAYQLEVTDPWAPEAV